MAKFNPSIIDYLGKLDDGVLVLISIVYQQQYHEATFYYTQEQMVLTISEELESEIGHDIKQDEEYADLLKEILKRIIPHNEIFSRLDPVDFSKWTSLVDDIPENQSEVEYLDDIKSEETNFGKYHHSKRCE